MTIRVNVHPRHTMDSVVHIPYIGNSYNQNQYVADSYIEKFNFPLDEQIELITHGEPISRYIQAKEILSKKYSNIVINESTPLYHGTDPLFSNGYMVLPTQQQLNVKKLVDLYLEVHPTLQEFSQRYTYKFHDRDHGYFSFVKRFLYQYGKDMPKALSNEHQQLYDEFYILFEQLIDILKSSAKIIGINEDTLRTNLMIRINHNPPGSVDDTAMLVRRHVDNTIMTAMIYQNFSGACVDQGQEQELNLQPIEGLYNSQKEILAFPGFEYCEQANCMTPATFHTVQQIGNNNRASVVAFLKY